MKRLWFVLVLFAACKQNDAPVKTPVVPPPVVFTCEQSSCWSPDIKVCRDSAYIKRFTRTKGWTGGDATYSVDLKNGKTLWMFGDSFIDQVSEDRSRPTMRMIRNAMMIQDGATMTTYYGGHGPPASYASPPETNDWYWPGDGTVANGKLYLFMHGFGTGGTGMWDFFRTSIDLLTIDPETMVIESTKRLFAKPAISWGASIMEDSLYTYVYGVRSEGLVKQLYVARTNPDLSAAWEFFTGADWSADTLKANAVFTGVSEQFSIFREAHTYYFLTQNNIFGKDIYLYNATSPTGAFVDPKIVYCTPETAGNIWTYNAFAHRHLYKDSLLVSYNVNSFVFSDIQKSADNYRPYFVRLDGWKKK